MSVEREPTKETGVYFGQELRRWRKTKGMSQKELAEIMGIDPTYVSHLEKRHNAYIKLLDRVTDALGLSGPERMEFELRSGFVPAELRDLLGDRKVVEILGAIGDPKLSQEEKKVLIEDFRTALQVVDRVIKRDKLIFQSLPSKLTR